MHRRYILFHLSINDSRKSNIDWFMEAIFIFSSQFVATFLTGDCLFLIDR